MHSDCQWYELSRTYYGNTSVIKGICSLKPDMRTRIYATKNLIEVVFCSSDVKEKLMQSLISALKCSCL